MTLRNFESFTALQSLLGEELGVSSWLQVTQEQIDAFARTTADFQWIHTDPARAKIESPYGRTIAHGFLTLSLIAPMFESTLAISGVKVSVNYGMNRVRFTSPVLVEERICAHFKLQQYLDLEPGAQLTWMVTVVREGSDKPALVAEWLMRCYP